MCDELQHHHKQKLKRRVQQAAHHARHICTSTDAWRTCTETARIFVPQSVMIPAHLMAQVLSAFTLHPWSSTWRILSDSTSPFFFYLFLLSVTVFFFHLELFPELHYTKDMANLRCSAAEESEDTLNVWL